MTKVGNLHIFAIAAHGEGISGGDRIFMELSRRWSKIFPITLYLWEEGYSMCQRQGLGNKNIRYKIIKMGEWKKLGFIINYLARIISSIKLALSINLDNVSTTFIYSASDFWMDCFPALILKLRFSKIRWMAGWYQTAPSPWIGFTEGSKKGRYFYSAFIYWLVQLPIKPLVRRFADYILINNEGERIQFKNTHSKIIVVLGAVDINKINLWVKSHQNSAKKFDAVFQGRFHPQKGVVELVSIWKMVVDKKPGAKLAMIGDGPLMDRVKSEVIKLNLQKNVDLFGYLFDGDKKYRIFSQSKIVVHPSFFDSGGMASAEAMAFGLPCVGFNLSAYKSYYPKGMIKVEVGDLEEFANKITLLLENKKLYHKVAKEALSLIQENWSWDSRAREILNSLT